MRVRALLYSAGFLLLLTLIVGCGGGGGDGSAEVGSSLTISTDTLAPLGAALDGGGIVTVYNFLTGEVIVTETLDAQGKATVEVPAGLTVAIVITGTQGDPAKNYRLSLVIPTVPIDGGDYTADPVTSIAAEAVAQKYYGTQIISQSVLDVATAAAQAFVTANADADFSLTGDLITGTGTDFGKDAGLGADLDEIVNGVPDETNGVALAKIAVQQIKEAGVPLVAMVSQERPDVEGIFTDEVVAKYDALGNRLGKLIMPALVGDMQVSGDPNPEPLTHLAFGAYRVIGSDFGILILQRTGSEAANTIVVTAPSSPGETPSGTYTITAVKGSSSWTLTQTFSSDSLQSYVVTFPTGDSFGANPSVTGNVSVTDSVFTTPITFNGSLSLVGQDNEHYTQWTFTGALSSPNVSSSGTFQVNFSPPSPLPAEKTVFDFPSSASMTNGNITVTGGGTTVALTGNISVEMINYTEDSDFHNAPKNLTMTGEYADSSSGLTFEGGITGAWTNAPTVGSLTSTGTLNLLGELTREGHPTYYADIKFTLDSGTVTSDIDLRAGASTLTGTATGTLTADDHLGDSSLKLTNQAGVEFNLARNPAGVLSGSVKVGSETVATIAESPISGLTLRITYSTTPVSTDDI